MKIADFPLHVQHIAVRFSDVYPPVELSAVIHECFYHEETINAKQKDITY